MKRIKLLLFLLLAGFYCFSQQQYKVKIVSSDDGTPIIGAKIITDVGVYYSNDEGFLLAESNLAKVQAIAPTYTGKEVNLFTDKDVNTIQLSPYYIDIPEVSINNVNVQNIFQNTLKNYLEIYYSKPSLYQGVIKQKAYISGKISNFLVADINVWSKYNLFNFSEAKNVDAFFQMNLNNIRYYKTTKTNSEYPFNNDVQIVPSSFVQKLFMNTEIFAILNDFKNINISSKLIYNTAGIQKIEFKAEDNPKMDFSGYMIYNKNDNAIIYLEVQGKELKNNFQTRKNKLGEEYLVSNDTFKISYDFTKKDYKYTPTNMKITLSGTGIYKGNKIPVNMSQEIIFQKFKPTNDKGLKNKVDLSKMLTENIPTKEQRESKILLTAEEQKFINE